MLAHRGQDFDHFFSEIGRAEIVKIIRFCGAERLSDDHYACIVRIDHFFVLLTSQEAQSKRGVNDLVLVASVSTMDHLDVISEESQVVVAPCAKIKQIQFVCLLVV